MEVCGHSGGDFSYYSCRISYICGARFRICAPSYFGSSCGCCDNSNEHAYTYLHSHFDSNRDFDRDSHPDPDRDSDFLPNSHS